MQKTIFLHGLSVSSRRIRTLLPTPCQYLRGSTGVLWREYWSTSAEVLAPASRMRFTLAAYSLPNKKESMASFSVDFGKAPCPI